LSFANCFTCVIQAEGIIYYYIQKKKLKKYLNFLSQL
jgi:hypothetical protein